MNCSSLLRFSWRRAAGRVAVVIAIASVALFGLGGVADARFASLVMDANSGTVMSSVDADELRYPASLTKMMTLYLIFEALDQGRVSLHTPLSVSSNAAYQAPSRLGLRPGESISMENAILALVTKSANDVATVVAENLGGSEDQFAAMMTAKAHGLGMANTVFRNASGLPEPYQVTTARDMATLGLALINNFPHHYHYFSTDKFYYDGAWHRNHNRLLDTYAGVDGLKTGYTRAAGFNLVASAVRDGRRVIGVVLGARSPGERGRTMASLLDAGFGNESGATQYAEKQAFTPVAYVQPRDLPQTVATRQTMAAAIGPRVLSASRRDRIEPAPASDEWMIQVGAFGSRSGAVAAAQRARDIASRSAATGTVDVVAKSDGRRRGKTVYFARLGGLSEKQVKAACQEIRRRKSACVSIAPERTVARKDDSPETPSKARFVRAPEPAPPAKARKANRASVSAVKKPWGVQVGAFPAYRSAVQHAQKARKSAPASLVDGDIEVAQVTASGAKKLYRARITGIDREAAQHACRVLESKDMDCIVFSM